MRVDKFHRVYWELSLHSLPSAKNMFDDKLIYLINLFEDFLLNVIIKKKLYAWEKFVFSKNIIRPKWYFSYRKWNILDTISNKNTDCRVDLWQFTLRSLHILVKNGTYFQFFMIKWYSKTSFFPDNKSRWRIFRANGKKGNKS